MKKNICLFVAVIFAGINANAQFLQFFQWDETALQHCVKQLDEFMKRFNYELDVAGKPVPVDKRSDVEGRKRYIISLFNSDLVLKATNPDSVFFEVEKFAEKIMDARNTVYLHFSDTAWTAEAVCAATFKNKPASLAVFLKTEKITEGEYKWVIASAKGNMLDITPQRQNPGIMISPVENEIRFMNLPDISGKNGKNIINYSQKNFVYDKLSSFNTLIYNNLLTIEAVEKVIYHFNQVPGYAFSVEYFERAGNNSGWLISNIQTVNKTLKNE